MHRNLPARTAHILQRLITGRTSNAGRRPVKASARHIALKQLLQPLKKKKKKSQIISLRSTIPLCERCTRQLYLVAARGVPSRITPLHSIPGQLQEMRLSEMHMGLLNNKYIHAFIYLSNENLTQPASCTCKVFSSTCMRCYNQVCINKSENAVNTATKSSNTDPGRAREGLAEVCLQRKAFILETGEEKRGVMWWRCRLSCFTVGRLERQMMRIAKSSQSFSAGGKWKMRQQKTEQRRTLRLAS